MKTFRLTRLLTVALLGLGCAFPASAADSSAKKSKAATSANESSRSAKSAKIDINTADVATLETLPGVGSQIARDIVAARPFSSVAQLEEVPGIGPVKMKELKSMVTASKVTAARTPSPAKPAPSTREGTRKATPSEPVSTPRTSETASTRRSSAERPLEPTGRPSARAGADASQRLVNLNTASRAELEALPEIGPVKAQAIIEARPFSSVDDVMRVKGIKEGTFEAIKDRIMVR